MARPAAFSADVETTAMQKLTTYTIRVRRREATKKTDVGSPDHGNAYVHVNRMLSTGSSGAGMPSRVARTA